MQAWIIEDVILTFSQVRGFRIDIALAINGLELEPKTLSSHGFSHLSTSSSDRFAAKLAPGLHGLHIGV